VLQAQYLCRADFFRLWPLELHLQAGGSLHYTTPCTLNT
jgi:hypothetical protein